LRLANVTVVMTHTMVVLAMAWLGRSKSAANRKDSKENEQAATNHLQRKTPNGQTVGVIVRDA
jgi:hypothetical protein